MCAVALEILNARRETAGFGLADIASFGMASCVTSSPAMVAAVDRERPIQHS